MNSRRRQIGGLLTLEDAVDVAGRVPVSGDLQRHLIPGALEEVLRFASSVECWRRRTREATVVQGVTIPANAKRGQL